ncbi:MAG: vWA domain-containing protein [Hyphomicrobiales bacterium]
MSVYKNGYFGVVAGAKAIGRKFTSLLRDRSGHVAMIFGVAALPLFITVGVAVDMSQQSRVHLKLAGTSDAIALAAARSYKDHDTRDTIGDKFLDVNLEDEYGPGVTVRSLNVDFDDEARLVTVNLVADIPTIMMGIVGVNKTTANLRSMVTYEGHVSEPVSLGLVLDVSGSMNTNDKIGTLRTAARRLLLKLKRADPDKVYVRSGLTTYSSSIQQTVSMRWGVNRARRVIRDLTAGGGTQSTEAVERVGNWLMGDTEHDHHATQEVHEGEEFNLHRFMIFMTDGDNNYSSDDVETKALCDTYKADGIEIYTVAFEAPAGGRALLEYCATDESHYFDAADEDEFLLAFDEIGDRIETALLRIVE